MNQFIPVLGTTALLGSALVGGVFFGFSSFVMKACAKVTMRRGNGECFKCLLLHIMRPLENLK